MAIDKRPSNDGSKVYEKPIHSPATESRNPGADSNYRPDPAQTERLIQRRKMNDN